MTKLKKCKTCEIYKPRGDFKQNEKGHIKSASCKKCLNEKNKQNYRDKKTIFEEVYDSRKKAIITSEQNKLIEQEKLKNGYKWIVIEDKYATKKVLRK